MSNEGRGKGDDSPKFFPSNFPRSLQPGHEFSLYDPSAAGKTSINAPKFIFPDEKFDLEIDPIFEERKSMRGRL